MQRNWSLHGRVLMGGVCLCLACAVVPAYADSLIVDQVRVGREGARTRLVFDLSAAPDYRLQRRDGPPRLVLDLPLATLASEPGANRFWKSAVSRFAYRPEDDTLRITLELAADDFVVSDFLLRPDSESGRGHRLVIDLTPRSTASGEPVQRAVDASPVEAGARSEALTAATVAEADVDPESDNGQSPGAGNSLKGPSLEEEVLAGVEAAQNGRSIITDEPAAGTGSASQAAPSDQATGNTQAVELADVDALLGLGGSEESGPALGGYLETSAAYTYADPTHWSKLRARLELALTGSLGSSVRYKLAGRLDGDGAYVVEDDFYPSAVRDDQRFQAQIREFYVDFGGGSWAHRVGRQHIVWGEMVGLFLADVVSARDTREFYLQNFEAMRIPQWAWNTQYFAGDSTLELLYIPVPSVDNIGEPGADFYPFPVPPETPVRDERPDRDLDTYNWGVRGSTLLRGWSLSAYYYDSVSVAPTLVSEPSGLTLRYDPIEQIGATFSKDFGGFVFKGEAVYASDGRFQSFDATDPGALFTSDALDWVVGTTIPLGDWRWDLQLYGRSTYDHDPRMGFDDEEFGATVLVNYTLNSRMEMELLALAGLNREDYLLQPKVAWRFARDWRLQAGADIFGGGAVGLFGPYDDRDRIYLELKRWF